MKNRLREFSSSLDMELGISLNNNYHKDIYNLLFYIKSQLRKREKVLEIGTGRGLWAQLFEGSVGLDSDISQLHYAKDKGIPVVGGDCGTLPFKNDAFTFVFSLGVIDRLDDAEEGISEHIRVCKPGGFLLIAVMNKRSPTAFSRYIEMKVRRMTGREAMIKWGK